MPYTKPTLTGYNDNPPPDNGSLGSDNEITWAKHKNKFGDPLKTYADAINDNVNTAINLLEHVPISTKVASYILVLTDDYSMIRMNVAGANNLTVPPNSSVAFDIGTQILIKQMGAGLTTIVAGSGVTINSNGTLILDGQKSIIGLIKEDTNEWAMAGDHT